MQKLHDTCTVEACGREHHARGMCITHYARFKRGVSSDAPIRLRVREKPPECVEDGCSSPVKGGGLCAMHYARKMRYGSTGHRGRTRPTKVCRVAGCDDIVNAKGLCHAHYIKDLRWSGKGVDADRYQQMLAEQGSTCAICQRGETISDSRSGKTKHLAIDHDHRTGAVRGLLCSPCNTAIGLLGDSPDRLRAALVYLERHNLKTTADTG